jgi:hypothetical protein
MEGERTRRAGAWCGSAMPASQRGVFYTWPALLPNLQIDDMCACHSFVFRTCHSIVLLLEYSDHCHTLMGDPKENLRKRFYHRSPSGRSQRGCANSINAWTGHTTHPSFAQYRSRLSHERPFTSDQPGKLLWHLPLSKTAVKLG